MLSVRIECIQEETRRTQEELTASGHLLHLFVSVLEYPGEQPEHSRLLLTYPVAHCVSRFILAGSCVPLVYRPKYMGLAIPSQAAGKRHSAYSYFTTAIFCTFCTYPFGGHRDQPNKACTLVESTQEAPFGHFSQVG